VDADYARLAQQLYDGATVQRRWPLRGGVSASVEGLELALPDGTIERVVVRRHAAGWKRKSGDVAATEFALHRALRDAGMPVPRALHIDMSSTVLPSPFLVMELVDGSTRVDDADLGDALAQMADALVRLHALAPASLALPALPAGDDPIAGALQFLPAEDVRVRDAIAAITLAPVEPSVLHGDFWPGNVLWADKRIAAIIDWEDAALGDAASDVACCRVELACAYGEHATASFTAAYRARRPIDDDRLAAWDVYVSAAALATMAQWGLPPEVEAARRERTSAFYRRVSSAI
jgi:aminoglycoside phosphotransferase (APT) family kinase protein